MGIKRYFFAIQKTFQQLPVSFRTFLSINQFSSNSVVMFLLRSLNQSNYTVLKNIQFIKLLFLSQRNFLGDVFFSCIRDFILSLNHKSFTKYLRVTLVSLRNSTLQKSLISVFQEFFGSINKTFILAGGQGAGLSVCEV